ncbi:MAG: tetratricopeptide repeat protein [Calditrichaeota bacterium]|nr:MAG: tetratricopeptide repeat protein [Calditrichota bacterium]
MKSSDLFTSADFLPISRALIAVTLYDVSRKNFPSQLQPLLEKLIGDALREASRNIIKSERTRRRLLSLLQQKAPKPEIDRFRHTGDPISQDYFRRQFSRAISSRNARKIADRFVRILSEKLAAEEDLCQAIVMRYVASIFHDDWPIPDTAKTALLELADALHTPPSQSLEDSTPEEAPEFEPPAEPSPNEAVEVADDMEDLSSDLSGVQAIELGPAGQGHPQPMSAPVTAPSSSMAPESINGGYQPAMAALFPEGGGFPEVLEQEAGDEYVLPIRGLRKLETLLKESALLHLVGPAGCGKTGLISIYLKNCIAEGTLTPENVFYFRFVRGITTTRDLFGELTAFLHAQGQDISSQASRKELSLAVQQTPGFYILDDLHNVAEEEFYSWIAETWQKAAQGEGAFPGKLLLIGREQLPDIDLSGRRFYHYSGLSTAESNELIRDRWQMELPRLVARKAAQHLMGNPVYMLLFKHWWESESRTDTQLQRFVNEMPQQADDLGIYLTAHLYDTFERVNSRFNTLLLAISIFDRCETEYLFEKIYDQIGGYDFQGYMEKMVEQYQLLTFYEHLNRYELKGNLRNFYYYKLHELQMNRMLHNYAGQLYQQMATEQGSITEAIEGASHFLRADREEDAVRLLKPFLKYAISRDAYGAQILKILENVNFTLIDDPQLRMITHFYRGKLHLQAGSYDAAEADFEAAVELEPPQNIKGTIAHSMGLIARARNNLDEAVQFLQRALGIFEEVDDRPGLAEACCTLGEVYLSQGERELAYRRLSDSMELYRLLEDWPNVARVMYKLIDLNIKRGEWDQVFAYYQQLLEIHQRLENPAGQAEVHRNLGKFLEERGDWDQAIEHYHTSLSLWETLDNRPEVGRTYRHIGNVYRLKEEWEQAVGYYQKALDIFESEKETTELGQLYDELGSVYHSCGEYSLALGFYQKAREIFTQFEDTEGLAATLIRIGTVYRDQEEWEQALDIYEKALTYREENGDPRGVAEVYARVGDVYRLSGDMEQAMEVYTRATDILEQVGDSSGLAQVYFDIGNVHRHNRDWEKAIRFYQKALQLQENADHMEGMASTLLALGEIYQELEDWDQAVGHYQRALRCYEAVRDYRGLAQTYYRIGTVFHDLGEWDHALENYRECLPLFDRIGDLNSMAQTLGNISSIEFEKNLHRDAINRQVEILLYFQDHNRKELVERILSNLVACHQELGPEAFQPMLTECLERLSAEGVVWGRHQVMPADKAGRLISEIFYSGA